MSKTIGIDVNKQNLDCAYRRDTDQVKAKRKRFLNRQEGYADVLTWAESASNGGCQDIAFIVEPTSFYHEQLVQFLVDSGATVYLVNPGRVRKFAEGIGILSKNDLVDADLLTRYGLMAKNLIPFVPLTKEVSALKSLLGRLTTLEKNLRREQNREEKTRKTVVLHKLEEQSIRRFIKQHEEEIRRLEKGIRETIKKSETLQTDFDLLKSIPGIGEKTAWRMLVVLKSRTFKSAPEVASFLGLNPVEKRSGTTDYRRPHLSKAGNSYFRQSLFFPAMVAIKMNPDIRAQNKRLLENGKSKMCAMGAAMRKLVHICYGVLKNQKPYEARMQE